MLIRNFIFISNNISIVSPVIQYACSLRTIVGDLFFSEQGKFTAKVPIENVGPKIYFLYAVLTENVHISKLMYFKFLMDIK